MESTSDIILHTILYLDVIDIERSIVLVNKQWNQLCVKYYELQQPQQQHVVVITTADDDDDKPQQQQDQLIKYLLDNNYHVNRQLLLSECCISTRFQTYYQTERRHLNREEIYIEDRTQVTGVYNMRQCIDCDEDVTDYYSQAMYIPQINKLVYYTTLCIQGIKGRYTSRVTLETRRKMARLSEAMVEWSELTDEEYEEECMSRFRLTTNDRNDIKSWRELYNDELITREEYEEYRDQYLVDLEEEYINEERPLSIWKNKLVGIQL